MNFRKIKKITFALTLALGFTGAPGLVQAQQVQPKVQPQVQPIPRERAREELEKRVTMEEREAFRAGFRLGQADARARRRPDFNRSRRYQMGDRYYREDFRKGYARGYRHG